MNLCLTIFPILCILPRVISYTYPVTEEEYDVLLRLAKGTFQIPVRDRTNIQKAAVIKFWRKKDRYSFVGDELYLDGKKVI